jgi:endoglucanase
LNFPTRKLPGLLLAALFGAVIVLFFSCSKSGNSTPAELKAPVVSITSPAAASSFAAPANIILTATATDADGNITKVEFFSGSAKIGEVSTSPYSYTWSNVAAGTYTITAKAIDNNGLSSVSPALTIAVAADNKTAVERYGQLKIVGNNMVDRNNQPVQLRGMSLFWSQWIGGYYNEQAVKWLKDDWKCNIVRAALAVEPDGYLSNPAREKAKIIAVIDAAIQQGIYVLVDWHDENAQSHTGEAITFFTEIAQKYANAPNIIYEIWNEPVNVSWSGVIKPHADTIINAIRKYDPDNIIVVGTPNWSQNVDEAANSPLPYSNIAYTLHYYASTHKQWLRDKATVALNKGIALFVTEFGTSEASGNGFLDEAETRNWWTFLDQKKISWCNWSIADKSETSAALMPGAPVNGGWTDAQISRSGKIVRTELRLKNP